MSEKARTRRACSREGTSADSCTCVTAETHTRESAGAPSESWNESDPSSAESMQKVGVRWSDWSQPRRPSLLFNALASHELPCRFTPTNWLASDACERLSWTLDAEETRPREESERRARSTRWATSSDSDALRRSTLRDLRAPATGRSAVSSMDVGPLQLWKHQMDTLLEYVLESGLFWSSIRPKT